MQNPYINNFGGIEAYLPAERLSVAIVSTKAIDADFDAGNASEILLARLADALAPGHPVRLPSTG